MKFFSNEGMSANLKIVKAIKNITETEKLFRNKLKMKIAAEEYEKSGENPRKTLTRHFNVMSPLTSFNAPRHKCSKKKLKLF